MGTYEPINLTYYDLKSSFFKPQSGDREYYRMYYCCQKDTCDAYKCGQCVMLNGLYGHRCPYGKTEVVNGFTKSARKCGKLIADIKAKYPELCYKLKAIPSLCKINDYVYLGLPHLVNYVNPIRDSSFFISGDMIPAKEFTPQFVQELLDFQPRALMGGIIIDYQKEHIPKFCFKLKGYLPEMYNNITSINSKIESICESVSFVNKKAKVKTLLPGKVKIGIHTIEWDGTNLITDAKEMAIFGLSNEKVTIDVNDDTIVIIIDDSIVTDNTIFVE